MEGSQDPPVEPSRPEDEFYKAQFDPLISRLVAIARRVLHDESLAWDAVQEALIQFWREPSPPPNPRAWLIRAVSFRSLFLARTIARRRSHERRACSRRAESSTRDDPSNLLASRELAAEVKRLLSELPPGCREVVLLRSDDELDYAEIARVLNIPIGTVRSRLNRTRKWMLREIAGDEEDDRAACPVPRARPEAVLC